MAKFRSEEARVSYLETARWDGSPVCPRCKCINVYRCKTRPNYLCRKCRRTFTARHGTIFEDSKLRLRLWFSAIYLVTTSKAGISSVELGEKLGISQQAAWFMLQRIHYAATFGGAQKPHVSPLKVDMSFDELMQKVVRVPSPRTSQQRKDVA